MKKMVLMSTNVKTNDNDKNVKSDEEVRHLC